MRYSKHWVVAVSALAFAGLVSAASASDAISYDELDTNKDGQISRSEARAVPQLENRWDELDVDGNGNLSEAEFARFEEVPEDESGTSTDPAYPME